MTKNCPPFVDWQAVRQAPRSTFFHGSTADAVQDRKITGAIGIMAEGLFVQSNARVLLGQAANGLLRFIALPTQVYPAPTLDREFGLGPGMYHHFDVAMYAGNLTYQIEAEGQAPVDLASDDLDNETTYADDYMPLTQARVGDIEATIVSLAPVAPDAQAAPLAPAPLPGPAGALYVLHLRNTGDTAVKGKIALQAGDLLVGHYEDAAPEMRELKRPSVDLRQGTLILSRPDGSVGIQLHEGRWTQLEAPFRAERPFALEPGQELTIETHIALGKTYHDVMPTMYALHLRSALDWLNLTASFWHERLGRLQVGHGEADEEARVSRDIYVRALFDNFNCLQTDEEGNLVSHWQGAPSHGYGTIWGIDVEPTAVSVNHIVPELARQTFVFFMTRSRVPKGPADHSVPILVAPVIIARKWLEATGDVAYLESHPDVMAELQSIMDDLEALRAADVALYPSRYSSDGPVGRRYDYGTNVKVWYALDSYAYLLEALGRHDDAACYVARAAATRDAIPCTMAIEGPFGPQVSGGTNLGEDPGNFYLPEGQLYYDGEDTTSMLAPVYDICDYTDELWVNYHRFARSLWCPNYDAEFDSLLWSPGEPGVVDGTAYFSRLGGSVTQAEMLEAMRTVWVLGTDDVTGTGWWWPHGMEFKHGGPTRCSQGQGAWAWQYQQQWLGLHADALAHTLTLAPRGLPTRVNWEGFTSGGNRFDVHWEEGQTGAVARVRNNNAEAWVVRVGFRRPGAGAEGQLTWQSYRLSPGEEVTLTQTLPPAVVAPSMERAELVRHEAAALADADGVLLRRFGPATMWGNWEVEQWWLGEMPLAVRLVVLNGTETDWTDVSVDLRYPEGWLAQARPTWHWPQPDQLVPVAATTELGSLPASERTVAAFWVRAPFRIDMGGAFERASVPFHSVRQPGNGLQVGSPDMNAPTEVPLEAELRATTADGRTIVKQVSIPVTVVPCSPRRRR